MRITNNMLIGDMNYNLNQSLNRLQMLQYQNATGKKFKLPSDDPIGASKSLKVRTDKSKIEQYRRNLDDANSWMTETETAIDEVNKILHRANQLMVQASNETNDDDDLLKIQEEVTELKESLFQVANTTYGGRYIFSGYDTDKPLLVKDEGEIVYNPEIKDLKPEEEFNYNIGVAEDVIVNTPGNSIFGVGKYKEVNKDEEENNDPYNKTINDGGNGDKPYLISMFEEIEKRLKKPKDENDKPSEEAIDRSITDIQNARSNILSVVSKVGARNNRLNVTKDKLESQKLNTEELLSSVEDVSLPEARMQFLLEMNVYNASLSVGAQVVQPTLVDFIR